MFLEIVLYEVGTTAASLLGLKAISMANVKHQLQGIKRTKHLPIIDKYLKNQVGRVSKHEAWLAARAVKTIQAISQYDAFKPLLILLGRKARESQMAKTAGSRGLLFTGRKHNPWYLLPR